MCGGGGGTCSVSWLKYRKTLSAGIYVAVVSAKLNMNKKVE